ncbi:hypothetical protein PTKIN_Ptkin17bG0118200 [Pterospermum kingtungense]
MERSIGDWPVDILTEIVLKLPVKSILRFKCVAKTWCHLFQSPSFVSQHFNISKRNKHLVVYYRNDEHDVNDMGLIVDNDQPLVCYRDLGQELSSNFPHMYVNHFLVDNGLLCLLDLVNCRIILWNPATREFRVIPECVQFFREDAYGAIPLLGFGLDPLSNDYKVIIVQDYYSVRGQQRYHAVYKMSTDSWRVLEEEEVQFFEDIDMGDNETNACVNGIYYWKGAKGLGPGLQEHKIVAFHLGTEVFRVIQLPLSRLTGRLLALHDRISIWDDQLHGNQQLSNEKRIFTVWALNDEGHWTKFLKIEPEPEPFLVVGLFVFWKNNKLVVEPRSRQLLVYDLESKELKEIGYHTREFIEFPFVFTYEESLVAVRRV